MPLSPIYDWYLILLNSKECNSQRFANTFDNPPTLQYQIGCWFTNHCNALQRSRFICISWDFWGDLYCRVPVSLHFRESRICRVSASLHFRDKQDLKSKFEQHSQSVCVVAPESHTQWRGSRSLNRVIG